MPPQEMRNQYAREIQLHHVVLIHIDLFAGFFIATVFVAQFLIEKLLEPHGIDGEFRVSTDRVFVCFFVSSKQIRQVEVKLRRPRVAKLRMNVVERLLEYQGIAEKDSLKQLEEL